MMTNALKSIGYTLCVLTTLGACKLTPIESVVENPIEEKKQSLSLRAVNALEFNTTGILAANAVIPIADLKATGGSLTGNSILVDNMPEIIESEGWLMAPPQTNGNKQAVTGDTEYYTFHYNKTGVAGYYVLLASNPQRDQAITINSQGVLLAKDDVGVFTFPNTDYVIEKESYEVADRFINNNFNVNTGNISIPFLGSGQSNAKVLAYRKVGNGNGIDGRFKMKITGQAYIYSVFVIQKSGETIDKMLQRAIQMATTDTGSMADVAKRANGEWLDKFGYIVETFVGNTPTGTPAGRYGRECGLYQKSGWLINNDITLPATKGFLGFCMVNDRKTVNYPEDQTAPNTALTPVDARRYPIIKDFSNATRSYGNYGHYYDVTLKFINTQARTRNMALSFAFNTPDASKQNARFVGPMKVKVGTNNETTVPVMVRLNEPRKTLANFTVGANNSQTVKIRFYVPGLITAGNQLIVETLN
ncbi:MAG: hypothetical protein MUC49_01085 [Raineya sp.]|jgi:hypothetical protein|nr:hypothetical protein [Raineya sp.]